MTGGRTANSMDFSFSISRTRSWAAGDPFSTTKPFLVKVWLS